MKKRKKKRGRNQDMYGDLTWDISEFWFGMTIWI